MGNKKTNLSRKVYPLTGSLLIHAVVFSLLLFLPNIQNKILPIKIDVIDIGENNTRLKNQTHPYGKSKKSAAAKSTHNENSERPQNTNSAKNDVTESLDDFGPEEGQSLQQIVNNIPLINEIYKKINTHLEYPTEMDRENIEGIATIDFLISIDGKIQGIKILDGSNLKISGYALNVIKSSFEDPLNQKLIKNPTLVHLNFEFGIYVSQEARPEPKESTVGNSLYFSRYIIRPNKFMKLSNNADFGHQEDKAVLFDLVQIWKAIFGNKKPSNRMAWDLEFKKNEFIWACENQNAEGGCYNAGLIEAAFGNEKKAVALFEKACQLDLRIACEKLQNYKNTNK